MHIYIPEERDRSNQISTDCTTSRAIARISPLSLGPFYFTNSSYERKKVKSDRGKFKLIRCLDLQDLIAKPEFGDLNSTY